MLQQTQLTVVYSKQHKKHNTNKKHPQKPQRIDILLNVFAKHKNVKIVQTQDISSKQRIENQLVYNMISNLQTQKYIQFVKFMWDQSSQRSQMYINRDTYYCSATFQAAFSAAKTTILAAQYSLDKNSVVFAAVRPPGHHSGMKNQPHGFCFFNNAGLAADYLSKKLKKIAIIDWDAHHGQGTQHLFYKRDDILYISLHRFDNGKYFPHLKESGSSYIGQNKGEGYNINIAWNLPNIQVNQNRKRQQSVGDQEYKRAFQKIILPVLSEFQAQAYVISCGFDSGCNDPIGGLFISEKGYRYMLRSILNYKKPTLIVLQGGYNLQVIEWAGQSIIKGIESEQQLIPNQCNKIGQQSIEQCTNNINKYWKCLN